MWLLILEALGALVLFAFIVWWTMFSGRRRGERHADSQAALELGRIESTKPPPQSLSEHPSQDQ